MPLATDDFLAILLTAATGSCVITYDEFSKRGQETSDAKPLNFKRVHDFLLCSGYVRGVHSCAYGKEKIRIFVKTLTGEGEKMSILCSPTDTVENVKLAVLNQLRVPVNQQKISFGQHQLKDSDTLRGRNISDGCTLHLIVQAGEEKPCLLYIHPEFRSPKFDFDYTNITDNGLIFKRGGLSYQRPIGSSRIALNVLGQYSNDDWLGITGRTFAQCDVSGEWPVSYHGTGTHNSLSMSDEGYLLCKGMRLSFGRGTYTTPELSVALRYADAFSFNGQKYKFILQNRVNPETIERISKDRTGLGEYWISQNDYDVRPYGICFMKC